MNSFCTIFVYGSVPILVQKLYVRIPWECLIITEAETMRPITVFRPYLDEVQNIVAIKDLTIWPRIFKRTPEEMENSENNSFIVTLGKGYRGLIERYVNVSNDEEIEHDSSMIYALLWKPDEWFTD